MNYPSGPYRTRTRTRTASLSPLPPAFHRVSSGADAEASALEQARAVLAELHALLESYAPVWFTQEHHERAEAALRELNRLHPSPFRNT